MIFFRAQRALAARLGEPKIGHGPPAGRGLALWCAHTTGILYPCPVCAVVGPLYGSQKASGMTADQETFTGVRVTIGAIMCRNRSMASGVAAMTTSSPTMNEVSLSGTR